MEFDFTFSLKDGTELAVTAEVNEDDTIVGVTFPRGCTLATCLFDAYLCAEDIEARAREIYHERLGEIMAERRVAGIAGDRA